MPSADIFQAVLKAFSIDVAGFLEGVDQKIVHGDLRQIPDVANLLNANALRKIHDIKRWLMLFGTLFTFAGIAGFFVEYRLRNVR
ncbi:MAG: hypothetical protein WDO72_12285 [Pseudomonadota bacterium]